MQKKNLRYILALIFLGKLLVLIHFVHESILHKLYFESCELVKQTNTTIIYIYIWKGDGTKRCPKSN